MLWPMNTLTKEGVSGRESAALHGLTISVSGSVFTDYTGILLKWSNDSRSSVPAILKGPGLPKALSIHPLRTGFLQEGYN